jgi:hypothetical protein
MSIPVTITLNTIVGTPGPFSLYSCIESTCSGSLTPFVTGVSLSNLQTGSLVPDGTKYVKIVSTGTCSYEKTILISGIPTPTPTSTPIPTSTPTPTATLGIYNGSIYLAYTTTGQLTKCQVFDCYNNNLPS